MKGTALLILLVSLTLVLSEKEVEEEYAKILSSKLWQEIRKRLDKGDVPRNQDLDSSSCQFGVNSSAIIRTRDSIELGAEFLESPKIDSEKACSRRCCETPGCNLAVFKNKTEERSCYLFNCGTPVQKKCLFSHHPGFSVLIAQNSILKSASTQEEQQQHEEDLDQVAVATTTTTKQPTTTTTTSSPTTTAPTTILPTTTKAKEKATLYDECTSKDDCLPAHSECVVGICICKDGYHAQNGLCHLGSNSGKPKTAPNDGDDSAKEPSVQKPHLPEDPPSPPPEPPRLPVKQPSSTSQPQQDKADKDKDTMSVNKDTPTPTPKKSVPTTTTAAAAPPVATSSTAAPSPPAEVPSSSSSSPAAEVAKAGKPHSADMGAVHAVVEQPQQGQQQQQGGGGQQGLDDAEEEISMTSGSNSPQGAVIALGLGLAVTVMLLAFVGCRLRMVKRRLRRGRPVNSNEADYLINGMYL